MCFMLSLGVIKLFSSMRIPVVFAHLNSIQKRDSSIICLRYSANFWLFIHEIYWMFLLFDFYVVHESHNWSTCKCRFVCFTGILVERLKIYFTIITIPWESVLFRAVENFSRRESYALVGACFFGGKSISAAHSKIIADPFLSLKIFLFVFCLFLNIVLHEVLIISLLGQLTTKLGTFFEKVPKILNIYFQYKFMYTLNKNRTKVIGYYYRLFIFLLKLMWIFENPPKLPEIKKILVFLK